MLRTSLAVQLLRLCASTAGGVGLIPGGGTKIPQAAWATKKANNKQTNKQKNTILSEKKRDTQTQWGTYCMIPFI